MPSSKLGIVAREHLVDLLLKTTTDLLKALKKPNNDIEIEEKTEQVVRIHFELVDVQIKRKAAERPASGVPL